MKCKKWRIIFDYDDTLIRHDTDKEFRLMAEYLGLEYTEEFESQFLAFYNNMSHWNFKEKITMKMYENYLYETVPLFTENGFGIKELFAAEIYKDKNLSLVTEGAKEVLEYLVARGYYLCILTNGFYTEQYESIKCQGLARYFEKIYTWDNFYAKPDERAFLRALGRTCPEENVMIGNNLFHDIIPAQKLGIYTCGIHLKKLCAEGLKPDIELESLLDLKKIVTIHS